MKLMGTAKMPHSAPEKSQSPVWELHPSQDRVPEVKPGDLFHSQGGREEEGWKQKDCSKNGVGLGM